MNIVEIRRREQIVAPAWQRGSYKRDELVRCGLGDEEYIGAPQLPVDALLMMDRIAVVEERGGQFGQGRVVAEWDVRRDAWFFQCHFVRDPVMPGMLQGDVLLQLIGFFGGWLGIPGKGRAKGVREIRFIREVLPTSKLVTYQADIRSVTYDERGGYWEIVGDGMVQRDGKLSCTAKELSAVLLPR